MKKFLVSIITIVLIGGVAFGAYYAYTNKDELFNKEEKTTKDTLPKKDEPYENETTLKSNFVSEEDEKKEEEIDLKYDQYITANGYAGASDNVYYTRNGVLYHLVLSKNETTRLAEGIAKIESDLDCMNAYKGKDFKIIQEDEYVNYID